MLHVISGYNFHGRYEFQVRAPEAGGRLSDRQVARVEHILCGMSDCQCGGWGYGSGPDQDSASLEYDRDLVYLVPARDGHQVAS